MLKRFCCALACAVPLWWAGWSIEAGGLATATTAATEPSSQDASSSILDEIRDTGILRVAVASHAIPLSFRYPDGHLDGYCLDLIDAIATELTVQLDLSQRPLIDIEVSQLGTRFDIIRNGDVQLECGPNTIRPIEGVDFSTPFIATGVQFISKHDADLNFNSVAERLASGRSAGSTQIGALQHSATFEYLRDRHDTDRLTIFAGESGVRRGIETLQGSLGAFATDGLLILGELAMARLDLGEYRIYPENPLLCSPYGLILPVEDPEWSALVNRVITNEVGISIWRSWFEDIDAYLEPAEAFCDVEVVPARAVRANRDRQ